MNQYWEKQMPGHDRPPYRPKPIRCLKCDYETKEDHWEDNYNKCPACGYDDFEFINEN